MKKIIKTFIITVCLILNVFIGYSQDTFTSTVEFEVNTDRFVKNQQYDNFIQNVIPYINSNSDKIVNILLVGSASPEGDERNNIHLATIRANKIYSYIKQYVPKNKVIITNDYDLFLEKTRFDEDDYSKLRATYIEIIFKDDVQQIIPKIDTIYKETHKVDTLYADRIIKVEKKNEDKMVFSVYNSLLEDLIQRPNIGAEFYFHQMSWFIDGSFSSGTFYGKKYDIDFFHTGFRKYFNDNYDKLYVEIYERTGWYDTDILCKDDNGVFGVFFGGGLGLGYKFSVCRHWKITPSIRIGFDDFKFNNYYYTDGNGGIDVSFGNYTDGRNPKETNMDNQIINKNGEIVYLNDKNINRDFFRKSYDMYWFGPTYFGITIQRDFYIHK